MIEAVRRALLESGIPEDVIMTILAKNAAHVAHLAKIEVPPGEEQALIERLKQESVSPEKAQQFFECARNQTPRLN